MCSGSRKKESQVREHFGMYIWIVLMLTLLYLSLCLYLYLSRPHHSTRQRTLVLAH